MTSRIWILTMFPDFYTPLLETGVVGQALRGERGREFEFKALNLRHFSPKDFKGVDASPYGGGEGMVMRADVLKNALLSGIVEAGNYGENWREMLHVVYASPRGKTWSNTYAREFSNRVWSEKTPKDLVFVCGRYEGIDERFIENYIDEQISLGDFILSSGDVATLAFLDSALRFVPGVLGNKVSADNESFENDLLEGPLYTKPQDFEDQPVPKVLLSGHHGKIEEYRLKERQRITKENRNDLYKKYQEKK